MSHVGSNQQTFYKRKGREFNRPTKPCFNAYGGWLPRGEGAMLKYLSKLRVKAKQHRYEMKESVADFKKYIEEHDVVFNTCNRMIAEANDYYGDLQYDDLTHLTDYEEMCNLINVAIQSPLEYEPPNDDRLLIAFPINAILDYVMNVPAGFAFFLFPGVNKKLKVILADYNKYLSSGASLACFAPAPRGGDWGSPTAAEELNMEEFVTSGDPIDGYGYPSWNEWFIRPFKEGMRPLPTPDNPKEIINACESTPVSLKRDVKMDANIWAKDQKYSLSRMFNSEEKAKDFEGGTIYQAFLSAFNYHCWHTPVNGKIIDAYVVDGTYYSQSPPISFSKEEIDLESPDLSQVYISNIATRAVIIIDTEIASIGKVALIAIGMAEVSSCVISPDIIPSESNPEPRVVKGQRTGYFQFGGSTHCVIFQKDVIDHFVPEVEIIGDENTPDDYSPDVYPLNKPLGYFK